MQNRYQEIGIKQNEEMQENSKSRLTIVAFDATDELKVHLNELNYQTVIVTYTENNENAKNIFNKQFYRMFPKKTPNEFKMKEGDKNKMIKLHCYGYAKNVDGKIHDNCPIKSFIIMPAALWKELSLKNFMYFDIDQTIYALSEHYYNLTIEPMEMQKLHKLNLLLKNMHDYVSANHALNQFVVNYYQETKIMAGISDEIEIEVKKPNETEPMEEMPTKTELIEEIQNEAEQIIEISNQTELIEEIPSETEIMEENKNKSNNNTNTEQLPYYQAYDITDFVQKTTFEVDGKKITLAQKIPLSIIFYPDVEEAKKESNRLKDSYRHTKLKKEIQQFNTSYDLFIKRSGNFVVILDGISTKQYPHELSLEEKKQFESFFEIENSKSSNKSPISLMEEIICNRIRYDAFFKNKLSMNQYTSFFISDLLGLDHVEQPFQAEQPNTIFVSFDEMNCESKKRKRHQEKKSKESEQTLEKTIRSKKINSGKQEITSNAPKRIKNNILPEMIQKDYEEFFTHFLKAIDDALVQVEGISTGQKIKKEIKEIKSDIENYNKTLINISIFDKFLLVRKRYFDFTEKLIEFRDLLKQEMNKPLPSNDQDKKDVKTKRENKIKDYNKLVDLCTNEKGFKRYFHNFNKYYNNAQIPTDPVKEKPINNKASPYAQDEDRINTFKNENEADLLERINKIKPAEYVFDAPNERFLSMFQLKSKFDLQDIFVNIRANKIDNEDELSLKLISLPSGKNFKNFFNVNLDTIHQGIRHYQNKEYIEALDIFDQNLSSFIFFEDDEWRIFEPETYRKDVFFSALYIAQICELLCGEMRATFYKSSSEKQLFQIGTNHSSQLSIEHVTNDPFSSMLTEDFEHKRQPVPYQLFMLAYMIANSPNETFTQLGLYCDKIYTDWYKLKMNSAPQTSGTTIATHPYISIWAKNDKSNQERSKATITMTDDIAKKKQLTSPRKDSAKQLVVDTFEPKQTIAGNATFFTQPLNRTLFPKSDNKPKVR